MDKFQQILIKICNLNNLNLSKFKYLNNKYGLCHKEKTLTQSTGQRNN